MRGTSPKVGFIPTTPVNCAGMRLDPPSSVPNAANAIPAATATAEPALDPPGVRVPVASYGLSTCPVWLLVPLPRYAKSSAAVFPSTIAPAARSRATSSASRLTASGKSRAHSALEPVVGSPPCRRSTSRRRARRRAARACGRRAAVRRRRVRRPAPSSAERVDRTPFRALVRQRSSARAVTSAAVHCLRAAPRLILGDGAVERIGRGESRGRGSGSATSAASWARASRRVGDMARGWGRARVQQSLLLIGEGDAAGSHGQRVADDGARSRGPVVEDEGGSRPFSVYVPPSGMVAVVIVVPFVVRVCVDSVNVPFSDTTSWSLRTSIFGVD